MSLAILTVIVCVVTPGANVNVPLVAVKSLPTTAVADVVLKSTVAGKPLAVDSVTVKVAVPAPSFTVTSFTTNDGIASLSLIVPVPVTPPTVTNKVSVFS